MRKLRQLFIPALLVSLLAAGDKPVEPLDLPEGTDLSSVPETGTMLLSANRKYFKDLSGIRASFRRRLAGIIEKADRIELLQFESTALKPEKDLPEDRRFRISPYRTNAEIKKRQTLSPGDMATVRSGLSGLLNTADDFSGGAWCHEPACGLLVYSGDRLLFRTSFCWNCGNYFLPYPDDDDGSASWVGLPGACPLEAILKSLQP